MSPGERLSLPIYLETASIIGLQMTVELDELEFVEIVPGQFDLNEENIGIHENAITLSYHESHAKLVEGNEPIFYLVVNAKGELDLSQMLGVTSSITSAEAYDADYESFALQISPRSDEYDTDIDLTVSQNRPNPFREQTTIDFELAESSSVGITITDITGKVVYNAQGNYSSGKHSINLNSRDLIAEGIMFYTISTLSLIHI